MSENVPVPINQPGVRKFKQTKKHIQTPNQSQAAIFTLLH